MNGMDIGLAGQGTYNCRQHGIVEAPLLIRDGEQTTAFCPFCLREKLIDLGVKVVEFIGK